jgi:hypothetical protein
MCGYTGNLAQEYYQFTTDGLIIDAHMKALMLHAATVR